MDATGRQTRTVGLEEKGEGWRECERDGERESRQNEEEASKNAERMNPE